ncbi:MAG: c-type cytochrome biogenesis protein CcmI [Yoonia sp.]|nr:c-type cytochrome biogenesis protein CcmI [Yoonia sp.]
MFFWIICILLTAVVGVMVAAPLWRSTGAPAAHPDVAFYRSQLDELDRDVARGVIAASDAKTARVEIARRLLAADSDVTAEPTDRPYPVTAAIVVAVIAAVGLPAYTYFGAPGYGDLPLKARIAASDEMREARPSQAAMAAAAPPPVPVEVPDDYRASVVQLRLIVPTRPDDLNGWALLATHEGQLRNFNAAAAAQEKVVALKAADATPDDVRRLLDLLVAAADGLVSPEAETLVRVLLDQDPADVTARYYLGALYNQTDRPDIALRMWRPIVDDGDVTQFHVASARSQIEDAAYRAGTTYTLPAARGPSAEDIANAVDLSEAERDGMIRNMVAGLSDRLATTGGPAAEWARLIRAYGVLGDPLAATEVWLEASEVFAGSQTAMATLQDAATAAGVTP